MAAPKTVPAQWETLETFQLPWNGGGVTAIVEQATAHQSGSDESNRLRIQIPGYPDSVFSLPGMIVPLLDGFEPGVIHDNLLASRFLYLSPGLKDRSGNPALLFAGWAYASDPGSFCALWPGTDGRPEVIMKADTFYLDAITDLDGNGQAEIVGHSSLSEGMGEGLETYDPFSVFRVGSDQKAKFDATLTKTYNLKHYCWEDSPKGKNLLVVTNAPNGKFRVLPETQARQLSARTGAVSK